MKIFKIVTTTLLVLSLSAPAFAWRPYGPYYYYPRYNPGVAAGVGAGILAVGILAAILIGKEAADRNQAEQNMLDSAAGANQYENYLIALSFYNKNTNYPVTPMGRDQWVQWRTSNGLEALR